MEDTLGKRIAANRKRLGLTQDALAEKLGVTAQAVSKWENDQSCPDITTLPRLAEIFGTTTDALLGIRPQPVREAEIVTGDEAEENQLHIQKDGVNIRWDGGKKSGTGLAVWVLLTGVILLVSYFLHLGAGLWDVIWPSALLVFGLFGLFPKFSFIRLRCGLIGGYFLLDNLNVIHAPLGKELLIPVLLLLFGGSLLVDALRKPKKHTGRRNQNEKFSSRCEYGEESFDCSTRFGDQRYDIQLPRLSTGNASVSFGDLTVDLRGCGEITEGCTLDLDCSFGQLNLVVPRDCRVQSASGANFANVEIKGAPEAEVNATIEANCSANFGEISIQYI